MKREYGGAQNAALRCLHEYRCYLTRQQIRTIAGQIKAGNVDGAMNGLDRILRRQGK